jgi:hypothetical protein
LRTPTPSASPTSAPTGTSVPEPHPQDNGVYLPFVTLGQGAAFGPAEISQLGAPVGWRPERSQRRR